MKSKIYSKVGDLRVISRERISYNLKRRIVNWVRRDRIIFGPVEIKKIREFENYYSASLILHCCAEDEMGYHDYVYHDYVMDIRFTKNKKRDKGKSRKGGIR